MSLYLRVRGASVIAAVAIVVVVLLAWQGSAMDATPSPTGATMMAGVFLAIAVPAVIGWGCARGDVRLEETGVRRIAWADLALALVVSGAVVLAAVVLHWAGLAQAGLVAARATLTYLGLLLFAVPFAGWRLAPVVPALFLLAVAAFGRGEDIVHPAPWAWLAADGVDIVSWTLTGAMVLAGIVAYIAVPRRLDLSSAPE